MVKKPPVYHIEPPNVYVTNIVTIIEMIHVQWPLYFTTAHGINMIKKIWSYIVGGQKEGNLTSPGTYMYRVELHFKSFRNLTWPFIKTV